MDRAHLTRVALAVLALTCAGCTGVVVGEYIDTTSDTDARGDPGPGGDGPGADGNPGDGDGDSGQPMTALLRVTNTSCDLSGPAVTPVFDGVSQLSLTSMVPVPGVAGYLALGEQRGRIVVFARDAYAPGSEQVVLDIQSKVFNSDEKGFHSMAFAPDFDVDGGYLYVMYSINNPGQANDQDSRVERYTCTRASVLTCDEGSGRAVIEINRPRANHNGGQIFFGGDDYLYITMGDSGGGGDPDNLAQNTAVLQGKLLRIDPSQDAGSQHYTVPADNPFVASGTAAHEIYAYGLRNPWRASYDAVSGRIFVADVGQDLWEEVDIIQAGKNFGWSVFEGTHSYNSSRGPCVDCVSPIYEYPHTNGRVSITGGYVYRGANIPSLYGAYTFADYLTGEVFRLDEQPGGTWSGSKIMDTGAPITSFGYDDVDEIYALHADGTIHRIDANTATDSAPPTLTATGCYSDVPGRQLVAAAVPYDLRVPFWSDGENKKRYFVLPGSTTVAASTDVAWSFPVGTILIKEFELQEVAGDPTSIRPVETRFLVQRAQDVWNGYSYIWNDQKTEATLRDDIEETLDYTMNGAAHQHVFPSRSACNTCHTANGGYVLGLRSENANRSHDYGAGAENQIVAYEHAGFFSTAISGGALPQLAALDDTSVPTGVRARSWLAVNCAQCHSGTANGGRYPDLRFTTTLAASRLCEVINHTNPPIIPGMSTSSPIIIDRAGIRGAGQMPPLATLVVDDDAMGVLGAWIDAMDDLPATLAPGYICP